jgi:uncharacterized protein YoxC
MFDESDVTNLLSAIETETCESTGKCLNEEVTEKLRKLLTLLTKMCKQSHDVQSKVAKIQECQLDLEKMKQDVKRLNKEFTECVSFLLKNCKDNHVREIVESVKDDQKIALNDASAALSSVDAKPLDDTFKKLDSSALVGLTPTDQLSSASDSVKNSDTASDTASFRRKYMQYCKRYL